MIHDAITWVAEALFYLMNGVALMNTPWIFVWIVAGAVTLVIPLYFAIRDVRRVWYLPALVGMVSFFPIILLMMGPPLAQINMMQDCETVSATVTTDRIVNQTAELRQCRFKDNYYNDFGVWQVVLNNG
jgi:hypothetical protein